MLFTGTYIQIVVAAMVSVCKGFEAIQLDLIRTVCDLICFLSDPHINKSTGSLAFALQKIKEFYWNIGGSY